MQTSVQKVMVTRQYGAPIYIAPLKNSEIQVTDKLEEAEIWGEMDSETKLNYHRSVTGWDELEFEELTK